MKIPILPPPQAIKSLSDYYVPVYPIDTFCPQWAIDLSAEQYGSHKTVGDRCLILVHGDGYDIPSGDWIVEFSYDDDDGVYGCKLWVAAKIGSLALRFL